MTLRLRLVLALLALTTVGLAVFGITTYKLYANSQYSRLDDQLRSSVSAVDACLRATAGIGDRGNDRPGDHGPGDDGGGAIVEGPLNTYGDLRSTDGTVLSQRHL